MKRRTIANHLLLSLTTFMFLVLVSCSAPVIQNQDNQQATTTLYKGYVVQLIASRCAARAATIKDDFLMDDYPAFVSPLKINNQLLYRVQIGPYKTKKEAQKLLKQLRHRYPLNPHVKLAFIKENH